MKLAELLFKAGVVGEGGAGFPTWAKLEKPADCYIVNAAECEPLIETDKYLMRSFPEEIIRGTLAAAEAVGAKKRVIAIKEAYTEERAALLAASQRLGAEIEFVLMPSFYPAGDEQVMVWYVTGKSIPARGLPSAVDCVVDNVGTVRTIDAALRGIPFTHKYLSMTGEVKKTVMLRVPIGTSFPECIAEAGPMLHEYAVINGGPMMGLVLTEEARIKSSVVTKTTGNLLLLPPQHYLAQRSKLTIGVIKLRSRSSCIQCRFCTDLCPRWLIGQEMSPSKVMRGLWCEGELKSPEQLADAFGDALNCCACGLCELYSCPMNLSPRRVNQYFKGVLNSMGISQKPNPHPEARPFIRNRFVPTDRLVARLDLLKYYDEKANDCIDYSPSSVLIPLKQGVGHPAVPVVEKGAHVACGELIAEAAPDSISSNVHASIDGVITEITAQYARIESEAAK